jgi:hypothetical protein
MEQLKTAVPELRWVDLDEGQIDGGDERPAIAFPAVLTGIALTRCETLYDCVQHCVAAVTVRIVQNPFVSRTAATVTDDVRTASLERYALVERIHAALQNFSTEEFNPLSRLRQAKETRRDGLFVYRIEYQTEFRDDTEG